MYLCAKNKIANNYGRYKITPGGYIFRSIPVQFPMANSVAE